MVNISVREKTQHERLYLHMFYFRQITIENFAQCECLRRSTAKPSRRTHTHAQSECCINVIGTYDNGTVKWKALCRNVTEMSEI